MGMSSTELFVSCVMPTRNRRTFVPFAIQYFLRQTYAHRELIIVDDGSDPIADLVPNDERIRYVRTAKDTTVGLKRNQACELARGDLIAHWDDDDWYAPNRLELQVRALVASGASLIGVNSLLYFDTRTQRAYEYSQIGHTQPWLSLLLYRKSLWRAHPHPANRVGSDTVFQRQLPPGASAMMAERELCVCLIHGENVAPKRIIRPYWRDIPTETIVRVLQADADRLVAARVEQPAPDGAALLPAVRWQVVIFACERPAHLEALLRDLVRERDAGTQLHVTVYDDATAQGLKQVEEVLREQGWRLERAPKRHGKRGFGSWVSHAYARLRNTAKHSRFAFLPDDCRLSHGFFVRAAELWQSIDDPRKATLSVHIDALRETSASWTGVSPKRCGDVWRTQWVDGAFIADRRYLEAVGYAVPPIRATWFERGPQVSSGVGRAISRKLHAAGFGMYRTHQSLIVHDAAASVMHPDMERERMATVRYVDAPVTFPEVAVSSYAAPLSAAAEPCGDSPTWVVTIMTYERPAELLDLLQDLVREAEAGQNVQVRVFDDASTLDYSAVRALLHARGWEYQRAAARHGKSGFHRWVTHSWQGLREVGAKTMLAFLQDDVRLCSRFLERAGAAFHALPERDRATLNVLVDGRRRLVPCWTNTTPRRVGAADRTQWVDGLFVADREFLQALGFAVPTVDATRWDRDPSRSSGVGEAISRALHAQAQQMYRTSVSLVAHVESESRMNPCVRKREPLVAVRFIDGDGEHRRLRERIPVSASLASIPSRVRQLEQVVASLLPQVDRLRVYLNGYADVPPFLIHPRITVARSQDSGDLGDAGKFFWCEQAQGYELTCDDDTVYPVDFSARLINKVEVYDRTAVMGVHGVTLRTPCHSYYRDRKVIHCASALAADAPVHILGTVACAWHASTLKLTRQDFALPNMADIWLGLACQRQRVPMIAISRPAAWLKLLQVPDSIYDRFRSNDHEQTRAVGAVERWQLHRQAEAAGTRARLR